MLEYSGFLTLDICYFILITFGAGINRKSSINGFFPISLSGAPGEIWTGNLDFQAWIIGSLCYYVIVF